ncbi:30S ribosomal protein S9 [Patescibacteria group bacterium]|nr:30S ribosomal protein S9 [Patescibacteria group bacterium]
MATKKIVKKKPTTAQKKTVAKKKPVAKKKTAKQKYVYAVGRRKTASAQVRLYTGKGESLVNSKPIAEYFPGELAKIAYTKPFTVCEVEGKYWITVRVVGSGKNGQLGAVVMGVARTLNLTNPEKFHEPLKRNGLLTRDSRARERRKAGQAGRARHKKQSPKR